MILKDKDYSFYSNKYVLASLQRQLLILASNYHIFANQLATNVPII